MENIRYKGYIIEEYNDEETPFAYRLDMEAFLVRNLRQTVGECFNEIDNLTENR